jgi:hypothetical protein
MEHTRHKINLTTRAGRNKLASRTEPYWTPFARGCYLGYKKSSSENKWLLRIDKSKKRRPRKIILGKTDDKVKPDGLTVLNFRQALNSARACYTEMN